MKDEELRKYLNFVCYKSVTFEHMKELINLLDKRIGRLENLLDDVVKQNENNTDRS